MTRFLLTVVNTLDRELSTQIICATVTVRRTRNEYCASHIIQDFERDGTCVFLMIKRQSECTSFDTYFWCAYGSTPFAPLRQDPDNWVLRTRNVLFCIDACRASRNVKGFSRTNRRKCTRT